MQKKWYLENPITENLLYYYLIGLYNWMCQFLCCDCWWCNWFGVCCGGVHQAYCLCSFWLCKPHDLKGIDPDCCHICAFDGFGGNFCCLGDVCCASNSVRTWSHMRSSKGSPSAWFFIGFILLFCSDLYLYYNQINHIWHIFKKSVQFYNIHGPSAAVDSHAVCFICWKLALVLAHELRVKQYSLGVIA